MEHTTTVFLRSPSAPLFPVMDWLSYTLKLINQSCFVFFSTVFFSLIHIHPVCLEKVLQESTRKSSAGLAGNYPARMIRRDDVVICGRPRTDRNMAPRYCVCLTFEGPSSDTPETELNRAKWQPCERRFNLPDISPQRPHWISQEQWNTQIFLHTFD